MPVKPGGFTNPEMWDLYGVREPIWGHVYDRTLAFLDRGRGSCGLGGFTEPRIEPEIVFRFRTAPRPGADLLEALDWAAHGFEIVQSHFPGWRFQAADTVADGGLHGTLLVGPPRPLASLGPDPAGALAGFTLDLVRDGRIQAEGRGSNVLGSPLAALEHLLAVLAAQPESEPIQAGEVVTTGTITPALAVRPGETWTTVLRGVDLPGIRVEFT